MAKKKSIDDHMLTLGVVFGIALWLVMDSLLGLAIGIGVGLGMSHLKSKPKRPKR